jgi:hypothetical protein
MKIVQTEVKAQLDLINLFRRLRSYSLAASMNYDPMVLNVIGARAKSKPIEDESVLRN